MRSCAQSASPGDSPTETAGYGHAAYAVSLAEFGQPLRLPRSGAWLLRRRIPGSPRYDAMGCYPLFLAQNWSELSGDLGGLEPELVSVALVADPFGNYTVEHLANCFSVVFPFKQHFILDYSKPICFSKHHSYYARKAASTVRIEVGPPPPGFCAEWTRLYGELIRRRGLVGIKAFSRTAFQIQLGIPGMIAIRALENNVLVGAHLWYEANDVAYSHLAAATERGYQLNCSYAIYAAAIEYFRARLMFIDLGGGPSNESAKDGLAWFKRGWSNAFRTAYFCGRIVNLQSYNALVEATGKLENGYFPAYRSGELV